MFNIDEKLNEQKKIKWIINYLLHVYDKDKEVWIMTISKNDFLVKNLIDKLEKHIIQIS